jgi:hypothetical protein
MATTGLGKNHRDRKNGASREEWTARKAAANAARPPQLTVTDQDGKVHRGPR